MTKHFASTEKQLLASNRAALEHAFIDDTMRPRRLSRLPMECDLTNRRPRSADGNAVPISG